MYKTPLYTYICNYVYEQLKNTNSGDKCALTESELCLLAKL